MKRWIAALLAVMMLCLCGCSGNGGKASVSGSTWVTYRSEGGRVKNGENRDIFVYSYQQPVLAGNGSGVHVINTKLDNVPIPWQPGYNEVTLTYSNFNLVGGEYYFDVGIFDKTGIVNLDYKARIKNFFVKMDYIAEGVVVLDHEWSVKR